MNRADADVSDFGSMLAEAMRCKARSLGVRRYTFRDLARDSDTHYTTGHKAVKYGQVPNDDDIIAAWSRALAPCFPLDAALIAAHLPSSPSKRSILRFAIELPDRGAEIAGKIAHGIFFEEDPSSDDESKAQREPQGNAERKHQNGRDDHTVAQ